MKKRFSGITVTALVMVSLFAGMGINELVSGDDIYAQLNKFKDILILTEKNYLEEVDTKELTEAAITGLLDKLDPHSVYIAPKNFERVTEEFKGKYEGIGISFRILNDTITVLEPIGGGPSARLGILSNDRIVKINDQSAVGFNETQVQQNLRGQKGTRVTVTIVRPGVGEPMVFDITRDEISLASLDAAFMVTDEVGYIQSTKFNEQTFTEMNRSLQELKSKGMKKLILDLRWNPGGYLDQAVKMADLFLDGGTKDEPKRIVYTKARRSEFDETFFAKTGDPYEGLPVIVLISNHSASASEIVAGAIQDWDRGLVIGETSFGKGLVQRQWPLSDGSALRLTIARYYTPTGRLIQREYEGRNRAEYQREAFERNEEEGRNEDHSLSPQDTARPVFKTSGGRVVYGGGGITPDYVVKDNTLTKTTADIRRRDLFVSYVSTYLAGPGLGIRSTYGTDLGRFKRSYKVPDTVFNEFISYAESKGASVDKEDVKKDEVFVRAMLKASIARSLWNSDAWFQILLETDKQFQKALTLFPEAEKIARLN